MRTIKLKNYVTIITLLAGASSGYAQGQISMSDYYTSGFGIQVYHQQFVGGATVLVSYGGFTGYEEMGQTSNGYNLNPGHTVYAVDAVLGSGYTVGLLAAPGQNVPLSSLTPVPGIAISSWWNIGWPDGNLDGFWSDAPLASIPNAPPGSFATVAIAVWENNGAKGSANSLHDAQVDGYEWGISQTGTAGPLGGGTFQPVSLPASIVSFSTAINVAPVPEPEVLILGLLGVSMGLPYCQRRMK